MNKRITPPADKPPPMKPNPQPAEKPRRASGARAKTPRPYIVISRKNILAWLLSAAVYGACMFCLGLVMGRGMIGIAGGDSGVEKTLGEMRQSGRQLQTDMERRIREEYPRDTLRRLQEPSDSPHQRQSATEGRVSDGGGPSLNPEAYDDRFAGDIVERDTVIIKTPKTTKYEQAHPLVE